MTIKQGNAPLPRLLLGRPDLPQLIAAVNDMVEYLETFPRIEIMERPQDRVTYPFDILVQSQDPRMVLANAWDQNAKTNIPATTVQWYRANVPIEATLAGAGGSQGTFGSKLTIEGIDGIAAGATVRMMFLIIGKAAR